MHTADCNTSVFFQHDTQKFGIKTPSGEVHIITGLKNNTISYLCVLI